MTPAGLRSLFRHHRLTTGVTIAKPLPHRGQVLHAFEDSAKVGDVVGRDLDSVDSTKLGVAATYVVFQNTVFEQCPQDRLA